MLNLPIVYILFLFTNVMATLFMVGVIYFVQFVHYPLFLLIPREAMSSYANKYQRLAGLVVLPAMVLEAITSLWLAFDPHFPDLKVFFNLGVGLVILIWLSTFFLQAPCHRQLLNDYDEKLIKTLISTNWIRTVAWSFRAALMFFLLYEISHLCFPR